MVEQFDSKSTMQDFLFRNRKKKDEQLTSRALLSNVQAIVRLGASPEQQRSGSDKRRRRGKLVLSTPAGIRRINRNAKFFFRFDPQ